MKTIKVSEASGHVLDWMVAKCEGVYLAGDTKTADLLARIAELEAEVSLLEDKLSDAESDSLAHWERNNGPVKDYVQFFNDCFARLDGHYVCPSVTSDYDKGIIFAAIERGEGSAE